PPPASPLFPYTTLFRSWQAMQAWPGVMLGEPRVPPVQVFPLVHVDGVPYGSAPPSAGWLQLPCWYPPCTQAWTIAISDAGTADRSEEHTSELQSLAYLV